MNYPRRFLDFPAEVVVADADGEVLGDLVTLDHSRRYRPASGGVERGLERASSPGRWGGCWR